MTRELSELLGAREPAFRLGLRQLEHASGNPSEDIRLSGEVRHQVRNAIDALGLDPNDTTGPELYNALMNRLRQDDDAINQLLGTIDPDANLMTKVQRTLKKLDFPKTTFTLKSTVLKRLLKKNPPKKAMKQLGYRTADSMLKHEPPAQILAAASIAETRQWHRSLLTQYKKLKSTDFEVRDVAILAPNNKKWLGFSDAFVQKHHHNILRYNELGTIVMLPLKSESVPGAALTTLLVALQEINEIRYSSAYLKLNQVRPDFGTLFAESVRGEPYTSVSMTGEKIPWKLMQHYFGRNEDSYVPELFEPHVQHDDLKPIAIENVLAKLLPRFEFWKGKSSAGYMHGQTPVSLNLTDVALNFCNRLPYEHRIVKYLREHLWRELMLRYMHQETAEDAVQKLVDGEVVDNKLIA